MNSKLKADKKEKVYSVSELTSRIKTSLETGFPSIWVEGELSKVMDHSSGHLYLTLKEDKDVLDVTMWRSSRKVLKFDPEVGLKVLVKGRVTVYGPYGKYQIIADRIEPAGLGALQVKFEQLKKKLGAKGYFDEERKKDIPPYPKSIGVVTSPTGAAFKDISKILKRRDPGVRIILAPVLVEGDMAKEQVAQAIGDFNDFGKIDLMIIGRGGGSPESLWAFNEEIVADAIFKSKIPVISAVGHEIDFTIADFVADLRASTPSAAAELAVQNRADILKSVESLKGRLTTTMLALTRELRGVLLGLMQRPIFTDPTRFLENDRRRVDECLSRMTNGVRRNRSEIQSRLSSISRELRALKPSLLIKRNIDAVKNLEKDLLKNLRAIIGDKRRLLATAGGKLDALSPMKVLERGYSITRTEAGKVLKDESQAKVGDLLQILLRKGELSARVESKKSSGAKD